MFDLVKPVKQVNEQASIDAFHLFPVLVSSFQAIPTVVAVVCLLCPGTRSCVRKKTLRNTQ